MDGRNQRDILLSVDQAIISELSVSEGRLKFDISSSMLCLCNLQDKDLFQVHLHYTNVGPFTGNLEFRYPPFDYLQVIDFKSQDPKTNRIAQVWTCTYYQ